jgi:hypothetical protein
MLRQETQMRTHLKRIIAAAAVSAVALTFVPSTASASSRNDAIALGLFAAALGTIAVIAANQHHDEYQYRGPYGHPAYAPGGGFAAPYAQPVHGPYGPGWHRWRQW